MKTLTIHSKTHGVKTVLLDDKDYEYIKHWKWYIQKSYNDVFYAMREARINGKDYCIRMHRFLHGITDTDIIVDHIDHNGLNNQRNNLRECTNDENVRNRRKMQNAKSDFLGVHPKSSSTHILKNGEKKTYHYPNKWQAFIGSNGKQIHIGTFDTPEEAAKARDLKSKELFGDFASLNFP